MDRILWHVTMSLDGFIADRDDGMEWMWGHGGAGPIGQQVIDRTGAILAGRRGYDLGNRASGPRAIYGGSWTGPLFVLTHRPNDNPDADVAFLSCGIEQAVATARAAAGGRDVGIFGAEIARQSIRAGLLDEMIVHMVPVLLGDGVRLFADPGGAPVTLTKTLTDDAGQITTLRFDVS